jgi:hypothetical protein
MFSRTRLQGYVPDLVRASLASGSVRERYGLLASVDTDYFRVARKSPSV